MALLLRERLLLVATLNNCDVWYNLKPKEIQELSRLDTQFFARLMSVPHTTPSVAFFLEFSVLDIETYIKSRRIIYYHNLVNRPKDQILYSFIMTQISQNCKGDWVRQVYKDLEDFQIPSTLEYHENISGYSMKKLVKEKAKIFCLAYQA